ISGAACATTAGGNGVAFAVSIAVAAALTAPITASVANFILLLPQKPIAGLCDAVTRACAAPVLTVLYVGANQRCTGRRAFIAHAMGPGKPCRTKRMMRSSVPGGQAASWPAG